MAVEEGKFYLIKPGIKFQIPPKHKFQVFNYSNAKVAVLMMEYPFGLQDEKVNDEIAFPKGPWQVDEPGDFKAKEIPSDYIQNLYLEDQIAKQSENGYEYVKNILHEIKENVDEYTLAGHEWSAINDNEWLTESDLTQYQTYQNHLNAAEIQHMDQTVAVRQSVKTKSQS